MAVWPTSLPRCQLISPPPPRRPSHLACSSGTESALTPPCIIAKSITSDGVFAPSLPAQRVGVLRDILMRSPLRWVVAVGRSVGRSFHLLFLRARVLAAGTALRPSWGSSLGSGSKGGREVGIVRAAKKSNLNGSSPRALFAFGRRDLAGGSTRTQLFIGGAVAHSRRSVFGARTRPPMSVAFSVLYLYRNFIYSSQPTLSEFSDGGTYLATFPRPPAVLRPRPPARPPLPSSDEKIQFCQPRAGSMCV